MINNDNKDVISALHYLLEDLKLNLLRHYKGKERTIRLRNQWFVSRNKT